MKFSVLMSVYAKDIPEYLKLAIESVINQTIPPNEIILIIDGPINDALHRTIDALSSTYKILKTIKLEKNCGLGKAMEIGLLQCSFEFVARMDSDDIAVSTRFEKQLHFLAQHPEVTIVGGYIEEFETHIYEGMPIRKVPLTHREITQYMKKRCPMNHVSVMFRKQEVLAAGSYQSWSFNEDYYLWIRLYLNGCILANIPETFVYVRTPMQMYERRGGWIYFKSEIRLQRFMLQKKVIGYRNFFLNFIVRLFGEVIIPVKMRCWLYRHLLRDKAGVKEK